MCLDFSIRIHVYSIQYLKQHREAVLKGVLQITGFLDVDRNFPIFYDLYNTVNSSEPRCVKANYQLLTIITNIAINIIIMAW